MDNELETYYDNYNRLFKSDGFKQLIEALLNETQQIANVQAIQDEKDLFYRKGQLAAYATILNLESTIEAMRDQAEENVQDI